MSEYESGWKNYKMQTVENSLNLDFGLIFRKSSPTFWGRNGSIQWSRDGETTSSIRFSIEFEDGLPVKVTLSGKKNEIKFSESLNCQNEPMPNGGYKTFILCPYCRSKRMKLCLPFGASRWACRSCYRLTYNSCQTSNWHRGAFRSWVEDLNEVARWDRRFETMQRKRQKMREWRKKRKSNFQSIKPF